MPNGEGSFFVWRIKTFSTELVYVFGIVFVAWGVVPMEKADFGVSLVVAPAYLLYFDMVAYEKFHNGERSDCILTDADLQAGKNS